MVWFENWFAEVQAFILQKRKEEQELFRRKQEEDQKILLKTVPRTFNSDPRTFNSDKEYTRKICSHGKRPYFSRSKDALGKGKKVPGTDIYVETNLSANNAKSLCDAISKVFYGKEICVTLW